MIFVPSSFIGPLNYGFQRKRQIEIKNFIISVFINETSEFLLSPLSKYIAKVNAEDFEINFILYGLTFNRKLSIKKSL